MMMKLPLNRKQLIRSLSAPPSSRPVIRAVQRGHKCQYFGAKDENFGNDYYRSTPCVTRVRGRNLLQRSLLC